MVDSTFFNEVHAVCIRRFGGKMLTHADMGPMLAAAAAIEAAYRGAEPADKPREMPAHRLPVKMVD